VRVVAPAVITDALADHGWDWLGVVEWDGEGTVPDEARSAQVWVPPYGVAQSPDFARRTLASMPELQVVQLQSAGVEPWDALVPDGVRLCSGRGIHGGSTAELAVALVLATVRDLPQYVEQQRRQTWRRLPPGTVAGRRTLVVGAGDIGTRVAAVLTALDSEVTLAGRSSRDGVLAWEEARADLGSTHVLVVAVPHTPATEGLVDADVLAALPDGALVVNVARGTVVVTDDLLAEVSSGRLLAALDVTEPEPLPPDHPLWSAPGVLISPHVGGDTTAFLPRALRLVEDQLHRYAEGRPLENVITAAY
jgi:phosphoglycerate dehydrogenase-like enzyme